mmetsp:Transcript_36857/g.85127  ORF Transcript_36857/g.85127 Transcript_36857/m.85127 type:complete len:115 (+) Transcript_36857:632-976(+)
MREFRKWARHHWQRHKHSAPHSTPDSIGGKHNCLQVGKKRQLVADGQVMRAVEKHISWVWNGGGGRTLGSGTPKEAEEGKGAGSSASGSSSSTTSSSSSSSSSSSNGAVVDLTE